MKKLLAVLLSVIIMTTCFSMTGSAIATELVAGNSMETATNIPQFGVDYVSTLSKANEVDWFKFTTLSDDAYYFINLENYSLPGYDSSGQINGDYAPNIYVYDRYMSQLAHGNNNITHSLRLENNTTYYIKIMMGYFKTSETGNYEISIDYIYDKEPNTKEEADVIPLNCKNIYTIDGWGDVDWLKFQAPESGVYEFNLKNHDLPGYDSSGQINKDYALNIFVYDNFDKELAHYNNNYTFNVTLEKNCTYYIKLEMGIFKKSVTGTYSVTVSVDLPDTPTAKTLSSVRIDSLPDKTTYQIGEAFDDRGLSVRAFYSDGTSKTVSAYSISGFNSSTAGEKTLTVLYSESGKAVSTTFKITVLANSAQPDPDPDPDPDPGYQEEKDVFLQIIEALESFFLKIGDFFVWLINFILSIFSA